LKAVLLGRSANDRLVPFLCECADPDCFGRVEMSLTDYGEIHVRRDHYVVVRGHPLSWGEGAVEARERYDVVEKPKPLA
jgi:hypothetical protein